MRAERLIFFGNLALALLLGALAIPWAGKTRVDSSADAILSADQRNRETYQKISSLMPDATFVLVAAGHDRIFSDEGARLVNRISEALDHLPFCQEVKSLTHSTRPMRDGFALDFKTFIPLRATLQEWSRIREFVTRFVMSRNILISADGQYALFLAMYDRNLDDTASKRAFRQEVDAALEPFRKDLRDLHVLSFPFIELETRDHLGEDFKVYGIALAVLIPLILLVTLRNIWLFLTLVLNVALGLVALPVLVGLNGGALNLYSGILFPLTAGVQLTFLVHVLTAVQDALREGLPDRASLVRGFSETIRPALVAMITTVAGVGSLVVCEIEVVKDFGWIGAQAVLVVFALAYSVPLVLWLIFRSSVSANPDAKSSSVTPAHPFTHALANGVARHPRLMIAGAIVASLAFIPGWKSMRTDIRAIEFLHPESQSRQVIELLDERLGGINIFQLMVDTGKPGGINTPGTLAYLEDIRKYARKLAGVSDAYGYSQVFTTMNNVWNGRDTAEEALPSAPMLVMFQTLLKSQNMMFKDAFVGEGEQSCLMVLRTRDLPAKQYLGILEDFMAYAESKKPKGFKLEPVTGLHSILEQDRRIVRSQLESVGAGAVMVFLVLLAIWRSPFSAALVLLINLPPLIVLAGCMGYFNLPLNSVTVMIDAVVLGITTDEGIHFVSFFRQCRAGGMSIREALRSTLAHKLRPMVCTSALLACGLGLFLFSSFPPVADFGLLSAIALALAVLSAATVLPAALCLGHTFRAERTADPRT